MIWKITILIKMIWYVSFKWFWWSSLNDNIIVIMIWRRKNKYFFKNMSSKALDFFVSTTFIVKLGNLPFWFSIKGLNWSSANNGGWNEMYLQQILWGRIGFKDIIGFAATTIWCQKGVGLTHSKRRLKSVHKGAFAVMHCVFVCPAQKTPEGSGPSWK